MHWRRHGHRDGDRSLTIARVVEAAIIAHAREAAPDECCGLLVGDSGAIVDAIRAGNVADDPTRRYLIDPADHFRALRDARHRSLDVIGAYHSHPRSAPIPSVTDAAEGFSHFTYVIVGLAAETPELRAWSWDDGNFTELALVRGR
ncbi:MAG TPA: M67 family metallopeptidase [Vicinamibacterales bacterium]|nr:M67 family metallopeptidase [Vicinamibacterales bacterium]